MSVLHRLGHLCGSPAAGSRALVAALCLVAMTSPAWANGNEGRWWWDTSIGVGQQINRNQVGGVKTPGYDQQELRVAFGLNGYIVHPMVAAFRIDTELFLSKIKGGSSLDSDRIGLGGELNAFPRSAYPFSLFYRRKHFDFSRDANGGVSAFRGAPDLSTRWGGRVRARRGFLKGTLAGFEREDLEFLDPGTGREINERQFLDWQRPGESNRHRVRLERRYQEFGTVDLTTDDLTLRVEDHVSFADHWRWQLNGDGIRRESSTSINPMRMVNDYQLTNRFQGNVREQDILELTVALGLTERSANSSKIDAQSGSVFYRWRPSRIWTVAPFVQYDRQASDERKLQSPRVGLSAFWANQSSDIESQINVRASYGAIRDDSLTNGMTRDSQLAYGATVSLAHGNSNSLRKSFEVEWFSNEFRVQRERIIDLPDLGLSSTSPGTADSSRARFELYQAYDSSSYRGWVEWARQSGTRSSFGSGLKRQTYRGGVNVTVDRVSLHGDAGQTSLRQSTLSPEQRLRFATITARWRPARMVTVDAMYRMDRRLLDGFSELDGVNAEVRVALQFNLLTFDARVIERTDQLLHGGTRTSRTIRWGLSSQFGGWLPIVTGTKRRGVIR